MPTTTAPPVYSLMCRPVNLMFVLDYSQSINPNFYNTSVRAFVRTIAAGYPMKGEIDGSSSRIGIVQFASDANVSYPLIERTRQEFLNTIDAGIYYPHQGITNISIGLEVAINEFKNQGIAAHDNVMIILMTDGVSTLDIQQTQPAADRVHAYTDFFAGVGIDGINGNDISANLTNLGILLGNRDLAFADILLAEDSVSGIWPKSRKTYPCPPCKGAIFIAEMTETIGQYKKEILLNATKQIAAYLNANSGLSAEELLFSIATYGNGVIRPIQFQKFDDFNYDLDRLINSVASSNNPNSNQTFASDILKNLYETVTSNRLKNYFVLFMGESENISDVKLSADYAMKLAQTSAEIFVLDLTENNQINDFVFKYLVGNDVEKIQNYTGQSVADLKNFYATGIFGQNWKKMTCSVPSTTPCKGAIFIGEMTEVIAQERKGIFLNATKQIAAYLNANPGPSATADQLQFSIATYGNGTIRPVILQPFSDFNNVLDILIYNLTTANSPNPGQTNTSSILSDLYGIIKRGTLQNYLVLFMGESERILDIMLTDQVAGMLASTSAEIFVLDMTNGFWTNDYLFEKLVKNDLTKIYNYTRQNAGDLADYYTTGKFAQVWNQLRCNFF
uniref:VWFA domain-containing protein n=1 Tax=Panagrolaimus sp. JU765 TaxID=591449 RepID=A0AC34QMZ9_9BILA